MERRFEEMIPGIMVGADDTVLVYDATVNKGYRNQTLASLPISTLVQAALDTKAALAPSATIGVVYDGGTAGGTDTYTSTLGLTAYATNQFVHILFTNANTGAATLNINSLGAKAIQYKGSALSAARIPALSRALLRYDGTQFQLVGYWG